MVTRVLWLVAGLSICYGISMQLFFFWVINRMLLGAVDGSGTLQGLHFDGVGNGYCRMLLDWWLNSFFTRL